MYFIPRSNSAAKVLVIISFILSEKKIFQVKKVRKKNFTLVLSEILIVDFFNCHSQDNSSDKNMERKKLNNNFFDIFQLIGKY